jgi:hypothetical protein
MVHVGMDRLVFPLAPHPPHPLPHTHTHTQALDFIGVMERFAAENRVNPNALKTIAKSYMVFLRGCLRNSCTPQQVREDLLQLRTLCGDSPLPRLASALPLLPAASKQHRS